jgi:hypothetical protein
MMLGSSLSRCAQLAFVMVAVFAGAAVAQPRSQPAPELSGRDAAVIDLTGQWVAIVNEDWRWRMVTPAKGDYESVQTLNAAGRAVADRWDESQDGSCKAYGAGGLLRMPTRVRIDWADDETLRIRTDAGAQTRLLHFDAAPGANDPHTLQGFSAARWDRNLGRVGGAFQGQTLPPMEVGGSLSVTTTQLSEGWLRRNGVPYSDQSVLTEYFDRFDTPGGDEWFVVTTILDDPLYHRGQYITSSHFRREAGRGGWNQTRCSE